VQEDVTVEAKTTGTQVERVLAPDSDESSSLLEQISVLQGNEEKLRDAHRFIDMLKEENARHLTKISSLMSKVDRKEGAKKQLLARLKEEIECRETEERRRKNSEAMERHYEASAQGYANECKQLREQLEKAENEIKKLSGEVNLDIPAMLKEIEHLKSNIQSEMAFNLQSTREIERLQKTLEGRERAISHRDDCFKKVAGRNGELLKEVEELKQKLADCEKQRDEAEKGYGEREALAGEIHRLRREREDMILWGRETWKKVEEQGLEIAKVRQELKTHQNTLGELEVAEVQYLTTIRDLEARLKFTEERMENFKDLWVQATENNNRTPATSPITTPDAPLRRSSSVPLPSRCLFPDKRSREDEEEDKDKSPRSKKQLKF
jgi:chromosome segregation ATPase